MRTSPPLLLAAAIAGASFPGEASAALARIPHEIVPSVASAVLLTAPPADKFPASVLALSPGLVVPSSRCAAPARLPALASVLPAAEAPVAAATAGSSAASREPLESSASSSRARFEGPAAAAGASADSEIAPVAAPAASGHLHASLRHTTALKRSIAVGAIAAALEFAGGVFTGTLALKVDALHLISDRVLDAGVLFAAWVSRRAPNTAHGWLKSEALVPFVGALALAGMGLAMIPGAAAAFLHPAPVAGWSVLGFAAVSVISNLCSAAILRDHHGHIGVRGAFQHAVADAFGTFLVMIAGGAGLLFGWTFLMPFATAVLIAMLLRVAWNMGRPAWDALLDAAPPRAGR